MINARQNAYKTHTITTKSPKFKEIMEKHVPTAKKGTNEPHGNDTYVYPSATLK